MGPAYFMIARYSLVTKIRGAKVCHCHYQRTNSLPATPYRCIAYAKTTLNHRSSQNNALQLTESKVERFERTFTSFIIQLIRTLLRLFGWTTVRVWRSLIWKPEIGPAAADTLYLYPHLWWLRMTNISRPPLTHPMEHVLFVHAPLVVVEQGDSVCGSLCGGSINTAGTRFDHHRTLKSSQW